VARKHVADEAERKEAESVLPEPEEAVA